jgi:pimeloyl-ACP methyl ester carboxylesterase
LLIIYGLGAAAAYGQAGNPSSDAQAPVALPAPTGPFQVGTHSAIVDHPNRREIFTRDPADFRRTPVQVYYPSRARCARSAYFPSSLAAVYASELGMRPGFESTLHAHACADAPVAKGSQRFPLILFSHGLGHTNFSHTALLEDLASRGNIVVAINHTYGSRGTYFPGAGTVLWDNSEWGRGGDEERYRATLREFFRVWSEDTRHTLDQLVEGRGALSRSQIRGRIDMGRVAYVGHSYGGIAAIHAALLDKRIHAAVNLDASIVAGSRPGEPPLPRLPSPIRPNAALLVLNSMANVEAHHYGPEVRVARVRDSNHMTYSDFDWMLEIAGSPQSQAAVRQNKIRGRDGIALTRDLVSLFLACAFNQKCEALDLRLNELRIPPPAGK